jgi:cathepsin D
LCSIVDKHIRFHNVTDAAEEEPGGVFIMGGLDESLYDGEVDFVSLPIPKGSYWELPVTSLCLIMFHAT